MKTTLLFAAVLFTGSVIAAQPLQFQSLTPGARGNQTWVAHLNQMKEAERQARVRTFGMPPAPPNRWTQARPTTTPQPRRATPAQRQTVSARTVTSPPRTAQPRSLYQTPQRTYRPPQAPTPPRAAPVRQRTAPPVTARTTPISQPQPSQARSQPQATPRPRLAAPQAPAQPRRAAPRNKRRFFPVLFRSQNTSTQPKPTNRATSTSTVQERLAFMPNSSRSRAANPYAPYASKAAYERARARSKWEARELSARKLAEQRRAEAAAEERRRAARAKELARARSKKAAARPSKPKRSFGLFSIFKRDKSSSSRTTAAPRSRTSKKIPSSTYVTSGLPQPVRGSGSVIETTLFH